MEKTSGAGSPRSAPDQPAPPPARRLRDWSGASGVATVAEAFRPYLRSNDIAGFTACDEILDLLNSLCRKLARPPNTRSRRRCLLIAHYDSPSARFSWTAFGPRRPLHELRDGL